MPPSAAGPVPVPVPPPPHAAMQSWSAEQSALSLKQPIVAWQQPSALMHVLQAAFSKSRPTLPRHVLLVVVVLVGAVVASASPFAGSLRSSGSSAAGAGAEQRDRRDDEQRTGEQQESSEPHGRSQKHVAVPRACAGKTRSPWAMRKNAHIGAWIATIVPMGSSDGYPAPY